MGQLGLYERENNENDRGTRDKVAVDLIPPALVPHLWGGRGLLFSPQFPYQPWQFDRPREKADKNRYEIKRKEQEIHTERISAVTLHRGKRATDDVPANSNDEKLSAGSNQRRNSPERNNREHKKQARYKPESVV